MTASHRFTALVLAGSRLGTEDPVARAAGVTHKSLVDVAGRPMLLRVLDAVRSAPSIDRVMLALEDSRIVEALPTLAADIASGALTVLPTHASPAATVSAIASRSEQTFPLLVTTSDHALLQSNTIETFCRSIPGDVDIAVALCTRSTIQAAYPGSRRSYIKLGSEAYSGCNLFALMNQDARKAVAFWTRMEKHRKTPWKYALEIGPGPLLAYATGRLTLTKAFAQLSRIIGVRGTPVLMPMAEAAIDVDTPADLEQVRAIAASAGI